MTLSARGRILEDDRSSLSATFEGTITELQGKTEYRLLVSKCRKRVNGNATAEEVFHQGTQVVVRRPDSKQEYLIDGKVVPDDLAKVLDLFFSMSRSLTTNDGIFGTKDRKKVGDRWAMNSVAAAKALATTRFKCDPEDIKGSMKIEKVVVVHGTRCLQIIGNVTTDKVGFPLPAGLAAEKSNMSISFSNELPVDTSMGSLSSKLTMTIVAKGKPTPDAPELTFFVKIGVSQHTKRKFLK